MSPLCPALVDQVRKLGESILQKWHQVHGMAPGVRFFPPFCRDQPAHHGRQDVSGMLPADDVEAFEGLVDEIKRMATIGVIPVGDSRKQHIRELALAGPGCDCRD